MSLNNFKFLECVMENDNPKTFFKISYLHSWKMSINPVIRAR